MHAAIARISVRVAACYVYYNLAATGRTWIARGSVPEVVGLWWTHAVVVLLALLVILGPGVANRLRYRLRGL